MSLILYSMCAKARRMWMLVLLLAGSLVAYPQNNFPENLQKSTLYWGAFVTFPQGKSVADLTRQWNQLNDQEVSHASIVALEEVLNLTSHQIAKLRKDERQFLFKYQHLAIYLSGMNPTAEDKFDRVGIWMLTYPDARRYGLVVNDLIDERRDAVKSTRVAKALFKDLKKRHGANTEAMFVLGAAGWKHSSQEKIAEIEENLTTLRLVSKNFKSDEILEKDAGWVTQVFRGEVSIVVLSLELGLDKAFFRHQNPTLIGCRIPGSTNILLPSIVNAHELVSATAEMAVIRKKKQDSIVNRIKRNIPNPQSHQVITYRVKSGDVLGKIAEHYGVRVSKIKKWNNLRSDRIDINQKLTIYYPKGKKIAKKAPKPEVKFTIYEVQPGDTLWAISKKFSDVRPEDIMAWNAIGENLSIGQKLKIKTLN